MAVRLLRRSLKIGPVEIIERIRGRLALRADAGSARPELNPDADWRRGLHDLLGAQDCHACSREFAAVWDATVAILAASAHEPGRGYDAGITLAEAVFMSVRHLRPQSVVETGVARGITTRAALEAMARNGEGHLFSIDLPPVNRAWSHEAGAAITEELRERWTFIRGSSQKKLDDVLRQAGKRLSLFIHDSLHTYRHMLWEYERAWPALEPGGLLISDDIEDNPAFIDFVARHPDSSSLVVKEERRSGFIGVMQKPRRAWLS